MKQFINILFFLGAILFAPTIAQAQGGGDMQRIKELKVKIVLEEMKLEASKESKFLPLYSKYSDETYQVRKKIKDIDKSAQPAQDKLKERDQLKEQLLQIEKRYKNIFLGIISANELESMYRGEEKFRKTLLEMRK